MGVPGEQVRVAQQGGHARRRPVPEIRVQPSAPNEAVGGLTHSRTHESTYGLPRNLTGPEK
ncbi:hypothetical protein GCM10010411_00870 [Actinomadura fulvescens]|uniref:Uncharacterized protein n=1 Tax=Actinomadura fulvescens TaxID=46160 RepID=A0ABN3P9K9_9ACTN